MVLTVSFALSSMTGLVCHRRLRLIIRKLDISVGMSGPHDFAVRGYVVRLRHCCVHRIPHPTSVTIAKRPSEWSRDGSRSEVIWVREEVKYFSRGDWTGQITMNSLGKLIWTRMAIARAATKQCFSLRCWFADRYQQIRLPPMRSTTW
jgi:hypothetical protein